MFSEKELQLKREAELTAAMLKSGLNSLRKAAAYGSMGEFCQSFFSLSIGIERMLKIIIITEYRTDNDGKFPTIEETQLMLRQSSETQRFTTWLSWERS